MQLMQMAGDQRLQQLQQMQSAPMLKPRRGITQSSRNRPSYNVMEDPNYQPFGGKRYGAIGADGKVGGSWRDAPGGPVGHLNANGDYTAYGPGSAPKPVAPTTAPQSAPQPQGHGFMDILGDLSGGPEKAQPQAQQGPRINKLTGLPFGTMPGDSAYLDKLVEGAPKAVPVIDKQAEDALMGKTDPRTAIDPSLTALKDLLNMATPEQRRNAQNQSNAERKAFNDGLNNVQLDFNVGTNAPMADLVGQPPPMSPFQHNPKGMPSGEISGRTGNAAPGWPQPDFSPYRTPSPEPVGPRPAFQQVAQFDPYVASREMERQFDSGSGMYYPSLMDIMTGIDQKFQQFPVDVMQQQVPSPQPLPPRMAFQQVAQFDPYVAMQERVKQFEEQQRMLAPYASL